MAFFTPFQNLPVNPMILSDTLGVYNSELMENQSAVAREGAMRRALAHGFNVALVSTSFTRKQLAGYLRDVLWGGDWDFSSCRLDGPCIFVTKSAKLTESCNKVGVGYLTKNSFENLVFWDSVNKRSLSLELVMLELSIHETIDSYAVDTFYTAEAANTAYVERQIAKDALTLARVTSLPSLVYADIAITVEVTREAIRVFLNYNGERRSYFYRANVAEGYIRCEGLKHYEGYIPGWSHSHKLQER